jgi:hypothetical protein
MSAPFQPPPKEPPKASALLSTRELQDYKAFLYPTANTYFLADASILLPTAEQYADFLELAGKQRAQRYGFTSKDDGGEDRGSEKEDDEVVTAKKCGHALHPGHPLVIAQMQQQQPSSDREEGEVAEGVDRCPMCILQIYLSLLTKLWDKWLDVGGPWRNLPPGVLGEAFIIAKRAYYKAKTGLINAVDGLEDIAHSEAAWEVANPGVDAEGTREYGATKAVEKYRSNIKFPAELSEDKTEIHTPPRKIQKKKRLSYSPGTPQDTRHRPNCFYSRGMTSYDPDSPHACPDDEGWADYSFSRDWEYNVRQCRLLLCDKEPSLPNVTYRELTHELSKDHLIRALNHFFSTMAEGWVPHWTKDLIATADIFLVWKGRGNDQWFESGEYDCFDTWDKVSTLVGTSLEAHARRIGDVDIENFEAQQVRPNAVVEEESDEEEDEEDEADDFFNQESMAEEDNSEDYEGIADLMDLEDGEDEPVVDVAAQEGQIGHIVPKEDAGTEGHWLDKESDG